MITENMSFFHSGAEICSCQTENIVVKYSYNAEKCIIRGKLKIKFYENSINMCSEKEVLAWTQKKFR